MVWILLLLIFNTWEAAKELFARNLGKLNRDCIREAESDIPIKLQRATNSVRK